MNNAITSKTNYINEYDLSIPTATATAAATQIDNHHQLKVSIADTATEPATTIPDNQQHHSSNPNNYNPNPTHEKIK